MLVFVVGEFFTVGEWLVGRNDGDIVFAAGCLVLVGDCADVGGIEGALVVVGVVVVPEEFENATILMSAQFQNVSGKLSGEFPVR